MIRISGPRSVEILDRLAGEGLSKTLEPRITKRVLLKAAGKTIDDAVVVRFQGPRSFTGEDSVELHVHGGGFVASRVLEEVLGAGARQALPGEFSFRAVRNGKMSLSEAEAIADLIAASNSGAADLALEKMSGTQGRLIRELAEELRQLATLGEIGIDFADQDVDEVALGNLKKRIQPIFRKLEHLRDSFDRGNRVQEGVRVAFVGLPNAGKSSYFNALLGEDRSIVSDVAGTTRDIVRERLTFRGSNGSVTLRLEDTAGLRDSGDHVEKMGIERTQNAARDADLLLLVVDGMQSNTDFLSTEWNRLGKPASRTIGVLSKVDLIGSSGAQVAAVIQDLQKRLGIQNWLPVSALQGDGVSESARAIADFCQKWVKRDQGEVLLTRLDQLASVKRSLDDLRRAQDASEIDLFASDLRQALLSLTPLIGDTVPDDILGRVFSQFCIGK